MACRGCKLFVLGCHRSGTSMLAGVLRRFVGDHGAERPVDQELMQSKADNPAGFFESRLLVDTSDHLLDLVNARWDRPFLAMPAWSGPQLIVELERHRESFRTYQQEPWVDKDPRLCLLWPAYRHILLREPIGIATVRDPLRVASSLEFRNGFSGEKSALIWWLYHHHLLASAAPAQLLCIDDDALLNAEPAAVNSLSHFLDAHHLLLEHSPGSAGQALTDLLQHHCKPTLRRAQPMATEANSLLQEAHRHWQRWRESGHDEGVWRAGFERLPAALLQRFDAEIGDGSTGGAPLLTPGFLQRCQQVRDLCHSQEQLRGELPKQHAQAEAMQQELQARIRALNEQIDQQTLQIEELTSRLAEQTRSLDEQQTAVRTIRQSTSWKATRPLRLIGDLIKGLGRGTGRRKL